MGINEDAFIVLPGESIVLADLEGPGAITHPWFVQTYRKILGLGLLPYSKSGYFYIDYELYTEPLPADKLYFHAHWRMNPTNGWAPSRIQTNRLETQVSNLDGKGNYFILETGGAGQFIGCNHSVAYFQGTWWGEGTESNK
ncbi:hypothetical protein N7449_005588 [Penicillium cf. viridicatum]|uniref:Uncharacterized protein n=1 Tax=Penicillium cf. viridicatum TaxID=2972119 RepID=A0A9W9SZ64_9EURO|nr:hypothetical protein N7449_005588 [Penicillium cf. viridicatum]